ncbi:MAG: hypothetical protein RR386_00045 [Bacteroidaceae bacterium]
MAGTTTEMSKVKQVLPWYKQGHVSNRTIAKNVGLNKETVNTYINKAKVDPLSLDELLRMEEDALGCTLELTLIEVYNREILLKDFANSI